MELVERMEKQELKSGSYKVELELGLAVQTCHKKSQGGKGNNTALSKSRKDQESGETSFPKENKMALNQEKGKNS